jgi:hypothetical protein
MLIEIGANVLDALRNIYDSPLEELLGLLVVSSFCNEQVV